MIQKISESVHLAGHREVVGKIMIEVEYDCIGKSRKSTWVCAYSGGRVCRHEVVLSRSCLGRRSRPVAWRRQTGCAESQPLEVTIQLQEEDKAEKLKESPDEAVMRKCGLGEGEDHTMSATTLTGSQYLLSE